jgi:DNA-binding response OmpR family regulator
VKVLVVEDDSKVARFLIRVLTEEGYTVDTCSDGATALYQASQCGYQVIVLDWMLPELDGLEVCRALRRTGSPACILMLTARGEVRERVLGLEAGADDYLVKPFEVEELVARVRALWRRSNGFASLTFGPLEIDKTARRVVLDGQPVSLTPREFTLLLCLVHRMDRVVTRSELLSQVWKINFETGSNLVEVHISRIREKLGQHAWMIDTVRGSGYRLRARRGA